METLTVEQQAALKAMKDIIAEARKYLSAEAYADNYEGEYERLCAYIRWRKAQFDRISFTNLDHKTKTIRELAKKGFIRIISEERQDFNIDIFSLEILK